MGLRDNHRIKTRRWAGTSTVHSVGEQVIRKLSVDTESIEGRCENPKSTGEILLVKTAHHSSDFKIEGRDRWIEMVGERIY